MGGAGRSGRPAMGAPLLPPSTARPPSSLTTGSPRWRRVPGRRRRPRGGAARVPLLPSSLDAGRKTRRRGPGRGAWRGGAGQRSLRGGGLRRSAGRGSSGGAGAVPARGGHGGDRGGGAGEPWARRGRGATGGGRAPPPSSPLPTSVAMAAMADARHARALSPPRRRTRGTAARTRRGGGPPSPPADARHGVDRRVLLLRRPDPSMLPAPQCSGRPAAAREQGPRGGPRAPQAPRPWLRPRCPRRARGSSFSSSLLPPGGAPSHGGRQRGPPAPPSPAFLPPLLPPSRRASSRRQRRTPPSLSQREAVGRCGTCGHGGGIAGHATCAGFGARIPVRNDCVLDTEPRCGGLALYAVLKYRIQSPAAGQP